MEQVLPFYISRAPERLPAPDPWPDRGRSPIKFTRRGLTHAGHAGHACRLARPAGRFRRRRAARRAGHRHATGTVFTGRPATAGSAAVDRREHPAPGARHVADVGSGRRAGSARRRDGRVLPGRSRERARSSGCAAWQAASSAPSGSTAGRASPSVDAADFNGDGKTDLAVAAFGWRKTGQVAILENRTTNPSQPRSRPTRSIRAPGSIQIVPVDLNRDGKMDFVTLLAQEHETVLAYINKGARRLLVRAEGDLRGAASQLGLVGHSSSSISTRTAISTSCSRTATRSTTGS